MRAKIFFLVSVILLLVSSSNISHAVVTTNITASPLPPCPAPCGAGITTVTPINGTEYRITGGARPGGTGPNLFHSFGSFTIGAPDTANFFNDTGLATSNILSRVTGTNNPSYIFGTIQTTGFGNANLFLINPAGVVFGPNATLDIGRSIGTPGSFHVSTADYIRFNDPSQLDGNKPRFYADPTQGSILTSFSPDAFGFLNPNPAAIALQGSTLQVGEGQTLSVVGGNRTFMRDEGDTVPSGVTVTGGALSAPSGQINLVSVASPGEVLLPSLQYAPNIQNQSFTSLGTVSFAQGATLDVSGDGGGTVLIRGGRLVMDGASVLADSQGNTNGNATAVSVDVTGDIILRNQSFISASANSGGQSGGIVIGGGSLSMSDNSAIFTFSNNAGDAGNISVSVGGLNLLNASIQSAAGFTGRAGDISVKANSVTIHDNGAIVDQTFSTGRAGDITLNLGTGSLNLNHGQIETLATDQGQAGNIAINAGAVSLIGLDSLTPSSISSTALGQGPTGNISLTGRNLSLQGTAGIQIESFADGQTGSIQIVANDAVTISTSGISSISVSNFGTATGNSGSIQITTPALTMTSGSINTINTSPARAGDVILQVGNLGLVGSGAINTNTGGPGRGGDIIVLGDSVTVSGTGSGLFSNSNAGPNGRAGDIQIRASQVSLNDDAAISAKSLGTGNAGNIMINASNSLVMQNSSITTESAVSGGGSVEIHAGRMVQLNDSKITTSVHGGGGDAGNIMIDPQFVILQGSQVLAQAFGGNGGNIHIVADVFFADPNSTVSASSTKGISGTVDIQAPVTNLSGSLAPLPAEIVQAVALLQARCAARLAGGTSGSFVVAGRDGLPMGPGGLLPSPLYVESPGSTRLAAALDVPGLRVGRTFLESSLTLAPLAIGCSS